MLRTVGARLAEPSILDVLSLEEVVAAARFSAQLREPQIRLAAAIGIRVSAGATSLAPTDLIDLIGAAGRLGGRLHMMTRSLADHLEPQVPRLPASSLVKLCAHLGALEMFPQRLAVALEVVLPDTIPDLDLAQLMQLLRACGRLRWRLPCVLERLLDSLRPEAQLDQLDGADLGSLLYELYRLDLWEEALVALLVERLDAAPVPRKRASNILLALAYFSQPAPELCARLLRELARVRELPTEALFQAKTFEMAVRVGHAAVTFEELGPLLSKWLFGVRQTVTVPELRAESAFAADVSDVARSLAWRHEPEVEVGPYLLDFAGVAEESEDEKFVDPTEAWVEAKFGRSVLRCLVAVEADGPSHFYRPHGRPWHWTSTSKLRHRLLTGAGVRVAHVPYYDWAQLEGHEEKAAYLSELLLRTHRSRPMRRERTPMPESRVMPEAVPDFVEGHELAA